MSAPAGASGKAPAEAASGKHRFRTYTAANVDGPYVALTFDDGPNPETTPKLLTLLKARGVRATFFVVGTRAAENPSILRRMVAEGHEIGNHSWNHPQLPKIPVAAADKQIADTSAAIERATGKLPIYLRPPYGAMTPALRAHIEQKFGLTFIYWSVDPLDWKNRDSKSIHDQIVAHVRPGKIILLHDIHATTVAALPKVLDDLQKKGYKFVTVSELIAMDKPVEPKMVASLAAGQQKKRAATAKPGSAIAQHPAPVPNRKKNVAGSIGLY